jgi:hypothetical protein
LRFPDAGRIVRIDLVAGPEAIGGLAPARTDA